jgi:hypothetical protein
LTSTVVYDSGEVRMGATWNRYGEASGGNLAEDWARTLAHELGHYTFFLEDNYLGLDEDGVLIPVSTCPGAMSDPYRDDYTEFHPQPGWDPDCLATLSQQSTGRWDWKTITTFYPWLKAPGEFGVAPNPGPSLLPLAVTQLHFVEPVTPSTSLDVPIFYLYLNKDSGEVSSYQPGPSARGFLIQGDRLIDLGRPTEDRLLARGARSDDRLCLFEPAPRRLGCKILNPGEEQLPLTEK